MTEEENCKIVLILRRHALSSCQKNADYAIRWNLRFFYDSLSLDQNIMIF